MDKDIKKIDKNLIFLKSSVIAMGIIFVVLLVVLVIVKSKKINSKVDECNNNAVVEINQNVEKIELNNGYIFILTNPSPKNGEQEIIKIDDKCGIVLNRVILQKKPKNDGKSAN